MFFSSFSVKNDHSMILEVLISKYSGVVHTIQAFPRFIFPYDIVLCHSSIGAIPAIFEILVFRNEIVFSSNLA
jgi:hypothetical protein